jgi:hypothetical protein
MPETTVKKNCMPLINDFNELRVSYIYTKKNQRLSIPPINRGAGNMQALSVRAVKL